MCECAWVHAHVLVSVCVCVSCSERERKSQDRFRLCFLNVCLPYGHFFAARTSSKKICFEFPFLNMEWKWIHCERSYLKELVSLVAFEREMTTKQSLAMIWPTFLFSNFSKQPSPSPYPFFIPSEQFQNEIILQCNSRNEQLRRNLTFKLAISFLCKTSCSCGMGVVVLSVKEW